ncbi:hypothetical protein [Sulfurisphaera tokodaii]|uniref:Uncharacterized protein n=2 Tax=Sulfurisphaera tokodaii TaxID=111955 RepID=Q972S0_SULTO|nr:hypothetical protein [Sulfurisphaera tokodaii]BAB66094.1 hypothetical protein STK_10650 [Sulfurisphaera tokodaii str. 7]HII75424.1 hypothetical protein [Sulfurisphaera tokodaii]
MKQTIQEAEELAKRILKHKIRKTLGIYYIFWSTYIVSIGILYSIPNLQFLSTYLFISILFVYLTYTSILFYKAYRVREILEPPEYKSKYILFTAILFIIIGVWIYTLTIFNYFSYYIVSIVIYTAIVSEQIFQIARDTGKVRYYDYIAIITFIASMMLGSLNYHLYYLYFFPWIYAGVKSIIESYEVAKDEQ